MLRRAGPVADWIDRETALQALGVKAQTLYAYVSRGRVGVRSDPTDPRRSLYSADDIANIKAASRQGRSRRAVASGAIAWGEPVLETALSTVLHGRLFYRGNDAALLSEDAAFEAVAQLLIGATVEPGSQPLPLRPGIAAAMAWAAAEVPVAYSTTGRTAASLAAEAGRLVRATATLLGADPAAGMVHQGLANGWRRREAADIIRRALVLLADHELNPSTFAVRVTAATGASLPACLLAGLAALSGPLHGAAATAASAFLREASTKGPTTALDARMAEGRALPGFGHRLYAGIDPRAEALLANFDRPRDAAALETLVRDRTGLEPNIDFALAAIQRAYGLPAEAPLILFAAARVAGWLAHAIEQATAGTPIRPRAHYIGPPLPL